MDAQALIGRERALFVDDVAANARAIDAAIGGARVLIIGGAGSIGREVTAQIFVRQPAALHVIDSSENSLVELVRNLRSEHGHIAGETMFLPLDIGSIEAAAFWTVSRPTISSLILQR